MRFAFDICRKKDGSLTLDGLISRAELHKLLCGFLFHIMRVLSFKSIPILLFIAAHCYALSEETTEPPGFVDLEGQQDPFSSVFDLPSTDNAAPEDQTWASSLQPIDEYTSENVIFSSSLPSDSLPPDESSPCLGVGEDTSPSLFGRSDDWNVDEDYTVSQTGVCFQNPDEQPSLTIPNLLDLPPPDTNADPDDFLIPSLVFPRRPVCPSLSYYFRLCCDSRGRPNIVWDCVICNLTLLSFRILFNLSPDVQTERCFTDSLAISTVDYVEPKCQDRQNIWCCETFIVWPRLINLTNDFYFFLLGGGEGMGGFFCGLSTTNCVSRSNLMVIRTVDNVSGLD